MTGGLQRPALQAAGHPSFERIKPPEETKSGKYLTFKLADEDGGISLLKAREIIGMMPITSVPRTPDFVMSVINLRGKVIPVSDLRLRFGMSESIYTDRTCITAVEVEGHDRMVQMGTVVDAITDVLPVKSEEIEPSPLFGMSVDKLYFRHGEYGRQRQVPAGHRPGAGGRGNRPTGKSRLITKCSTINLELA